MPYFFIVPLFLLVVATLLTATLASVLAFFEAVPDLDGQWLQVPVGLVGAMLLFVGPFAASLLGVLLGIGVASRGARKVDPRGTVVHAA